MVSVPVSEIFTSIQGEGRYAGERHLFVRFHGCNINCPVCDEALKKANHYSMDSLFEAVDFSLAGDAPHQMIALTGGEPLLHANAIAALLVHISFSGRVLLETNGTLFSEAALLRDACHVFSMDYKLSSVWDVPSQEIAHEAFLPLLRAETDYIKIVVSQDLDEEEYMRALNMIASRAPGVPVYLHPYESNNQEQITVEKIKNLHKRGIAIVDAIYALPRVQRVWRVR